MTTTNESKAKRFENISRKFLVSLGLDANELDVAMPTPAGFNMLVNTNAAAVAIQEWFATTGAQIGAKVLDVVYYPADPEDADDHANWLVRVEA